MATKGKAKLVEKPKGNFRNIYKSEKNDPINYFSVEIHDIDISLINALKRTIQSDIEIPGFRGEDDPSITILENNGPLHNEILLHRIGLIPIHFNEDEVENFKSDEYLFEVEVSNEESSMINVTTEQMKVYHNEKPLTKAEIERLFPKNPHTESYILINRLRPKEKLHFKGHAVLGTATEHSGFSPVSLCSFHYLQDPKLLAELPANATILDKERAYYRNEYGDANVVKFELEIECGLDAKYLISKSIEILMNKLNKTLNEIMADHSDYIQIIPSDNAIGYLFIFQNENDTLGNLLQSYMHNYYIRSKNLTTQNKQVSYVGYICPHPLEPVMHLKIVIQNKDETSATNKQEYIELLSEHCRRSIGYLQDIKSKWLLSL